MVSGVNLINTLSTPLRVTCNLIAGQEKASGLSHTRFVQDTATNLVPKATFARSKADLTENTFLEITESMLVYYCPTLLGEKVFRKLYSRKLDKEQKKQVAKTGVELLKENNIHNKKLLPVKAAIALSATLIPLTEFTLNYFKNLLTLKTFKQGNFDNIANLNKNKKENKSEQTKVERSAIGHIKMAAGLFGAALLGSMVLAKKGAKSKTLQNISEFILAPGSKLFKKDEKKEKFVNKYFSLDFANDNGKLALSKGQLTACVLVGGAGYFGASKDRGKQNFLETLYRFPLVGFYVITGSELFEKGFKKILQKNNKCKELIGKNLEVPKMEELPKLAQKIADKKGTKVDTEFKSLAKQKALITGVPFLFSIGFMGFFVAGVSNYFTKYRFNKDNCKKNIN
jgi:hypothetical protein